MTEPKPTFNRRQLLLGATAICGVPALHVNAAENKVETTPDTVLDALGGTYGVIPGARRYGAKGVGALGYFVGVPAAAVYSRSSLFSGETLQVVARFSVAGGNAQATDTDRSPRGLSLQFRLPDGGLHHMTMLSTPMFFANTPKTFVEKMLALKPDPLTGKPDPAKLQEFLARHPESAAHAHYLSDTNPPVSYANAAYYGIHTFKFLDHAGKVTLVRFRFVPQDGEQSLSKEQMRFMPHNFLAQALDQRIQQGSIRWDMVVTVGEPGDSETDPTRLWPTNRKQFKAGTLMITRSSADKGAASDNINYDPLILSDGVAPSDDPILLFRSSVYALSFSRRVRNI